MAATPIYGWVIPTEYNTNYFSQFVSMMDSVDTTVDSIDQRVGDALSIDGIDVDTLTDGDTDLALVVDTTANCLVYGNDISQSQWAKTQVNINGTSGMAATFNGGVATSHFIQQSCTFSTTGRGTLCLNIAAGAVEWMRIEQDTIGTYSFVNAATGEIGVTSIGVITSVVKQPDGSCNVRVEYDVTAGAVVFRLIASNGDGTTTFIGDDTTTSISVKDISAYSGTIAQNVKVADGGASPVAPTTTVTATTYKQNKWDAGLVQKADGTWIPASSVDGDLMDESAGNVAVLHQNRKFKRYDDNTWETLKADGSANIYYSEENQNNVPAYMYYQSELDTSSASSGTALTIYSKDGGNVDLSFLGHPQANVRAVANQWHSPGMFLGGSKLTQFFNFYIDNSLSDRAIIGWDRGAGLNSFTVYTVRIIFYASSPFQLTAP